MNKTLGLNQLKQTQYDLLDDDPDLGQPILRRARMNHFQGIFAEDGTGYILQDRLIFIPNKLNWTKKQLAIFLCDAERISGYKRLGLFDTGLKLEMKSGKLHQFAVDKTSSFYDMLVNKI